MTRGLFKPPLPIFGILGLLLSASPVFAQQGCIAASPENPSLILGLIGGGVAAWPLLRARLKERRK